jgi:predicted GNAT family acetyltransferase
MTKNKDNEGRFINRTDHNRFELHVGDHAATAAYRHTDDELYIDYVEAPPVLRGTGAAGALMENIVDFAQEKNLALRPVCGYAKKWLEKHGVN